MAQPDTVLALVRVRASGAPDTGLVETELARAIDTDPEYGMAAEVTAVAPGRRDPRRAGPRTHGYVVVVRFGPGPRPDDPAARIRERAGHAFRHRFGSDLGTDVRTDLSAVELRAAWDTFRGTPHRGAGL